MHKADKFFSKLVYEELDQERQQNDIYKRNNLTRYDNSNNKSNEVVVTSSSPTFANTTPRVNSRRQRQYQEQPEQRQWTESNTYDNHVHHNNTTSALEAMLIAPEVEHVVNPLAMLRKCISYFATHPEIYGNNLQSLIEKEVAHVMRLNSAEQAMLAQYTMESAPIANNNNRTDLLIRANTTETCNAVSLPPISLSDKRLLCLHRQNDTSANVSDNLVGFGQLHLSHTAVGLKGFVTRNDNTNNTITNANHYCYECSNEDSESNGITRHEQGMVERNALVGDTLPESIGWHGQAMSPPQTSTSPFTKTNVTRQIRNDNIYNNYNKQYHCQEEHQGENYSDQLVACIHNTDVCNVEDDLQELTLARNKQAVERSAIVIEGAGYEATFLRQQMDQLQAAYNATCIRLHELNEENVRVKAQLQSAQDQNSRLSQDYTSALEKIELTRKEMELWKDRAHEASMPQSVISSYPSHRTLNSAHSENNRTSSGSNMLVEEEENNFTTVEEYDARRNHSSNNNNNNNSSSRFGRVSGNESSARDDAIARRLLQRQLVEAKRENDKIGKIWRETERALQEARRSFEGAEAEASQSHDHLSDAFHYIERLERHVARRDAFIKLQARRQGSLEEKYEKLM